MNGLLFGIIIISPLAVLASGWYRHARWSLFLATLPPLVASLLLPTGETSTLSWLLLGSQLGAGAVTQWLLPAAVLVWAAAALHHAASDMQNARSARFRLFFLLAMCGNLLLLLAQDAITFYVGYAMMGLAGYGLVLDRRSTNARVAAGTYLRWTIAGELMLFSGLLSLVHDVGSTILPLSDAAALSAWTLVLLISGFGIKIGLPGLHAWMPGTYSTSSTAGSAVFSGAMANAGILGLLHFLPLQQQGYTTAGMLLLTYGLVGVFYGALLGLPQRRPKVILAYSSVSQLGTLAAIIGLALMAPALAPALIIAVAAYAVHHGLTKAALFLALDSLWRPRWRGLSIAVLIALSLMMAGLPYSSGAVAKGLIKEAIGDGYTWLVTVLTIAGTATTLLMTRFVFACLAPPRKANSASFWAGASLALLMLIVAHIAVYHVSPLPTLSVQAIWPLAIAMVLVIAYAMLPPSAHRALQPVIPKGDLPNLLTKALLRRVGRNPLMPTLVTLRDRLGISPLLITRSSASARIEDSPSGTGRKS
jgi:formate hydrogenlyase subunit 3/multisubunit Na+/H+ antiporter MnhD subunit